MLDFVYKDLITTAFGIVAKEDCVLPRVEINGKTFCPGELGDEALLELLAWSPVRAKIEELREMLNDALGQPERRPDEELAAAANVFLKHRESGYLIDFEVRGGEVCEPPRFHRRPISPCYATISSVFMFA